MWLGPTCSLSFACSALPELHFLLGVWKHVLLWGRKGDKREIKNCRCCEHSMLCRVGAQKERGSEKVAGAETRQLQDGSKGGWVSRSPASGPGWVWAPGRAARGKKQMKELIWGGGTGSRRATLTRSPRQGPGGRGPPGSREAGVSKIDKCLFSWMVKSAGGSGGFMCQALP